LKYFDDDGISGNRWSRADIEKYRAKIACVLEKFLPLRPMDNGGIKGVKHG
jgi:hypothetical protein